MNKEPELSLLVIDLTNDCVIKNEGKECQLNIGGNVVDIEFGGVRMWRSTFAELKQDIDATDAKPPVPRAERHLDGYRIVWENAAYQPAEFQMWRDQFEVLEQLAGVEIPVWEPTKGTWTHISDATDRLAMDCGISIYRYTR